MKPDAASAGYLSNDGKETSELRAHRHAYSVYQRRYDVIRILQRIADRDENFFESTFRSLKQSPSHGSPIRRKSNQFVICHVIENYSNYSSMILIIVIKKYFKKNH